VLYTYTHRISLKGSKENIVIFSSGGGQGVSGMEGGRLSKFHFILLTLSKYIRNAEIIFSVKKFYAGCQWLMPIIQATLKAEIWSVAVPGPLGQKRLQNPI
jgi:hypothetical protein